MLCQICKKNPATIHIQEEVNGEKQSLHLCLPCAGKRSFESAALDGMDLSELMNSLEQSISEMGLIPFKKMQESEPDSTEPANDLSCDNCGCTAEQIRKTGLAGCAACYDVFTDYLTEKILSLHRSAVHSGKLPSISPEPELTAVSSVADRIGAEREKQKQLARLEQDLRQSILREEYELAAEIRDRIAALTAGKDAGYAE